MEEEVLKYIKENEYTWTFKSIMSEYEKYKKGFYISHTAKEVIQNCIIPFKQKQVSNYYKNRYK